MVVISLPQITEDYSPVVQHPEMTFEQVGNLVRAAIEDIDPANVKSVALRRLLEDVQAEPRSKNRQGYNRIHNRHNRGP